MMVVVKDRAEEEVRNHTGVTFLLTTCVHPLLPTVHTQQCRLRPKRVQT